jgi:multidrug efflux pump subunit AcrA (membrane-fusion protein)
MKLKTLLWTIVAVALAAIAYLGWTRWRGDGAATQAAAAASAASGARPAQTVGVQIAQQRDVPVTIEAAGTIVSLNTVDVRPQVTGTVADVAVREGQFVRAGDLLFRLDDRADRANVDKARAQLSRDRASLADLERQWQRARDLRAQNFIAQSAADTVLAQLDGQRAAIDSDAAALRSAEVQLSYDTIVSPLSGRAGAITVYRGTLVQPTATVLVTVSQIDPIGVSFTVPEAQLASLLRIGGASAAIAAANRSAQTPALASANAARPPAAAASLARPGRPAVAPIPGATNNKPVAGKGGAADANGTISVLLPNSRGGTAAEALVGSVSFVDNAVDTSTGTIRVKGLLPNPAQQMWPGQYVLVRMTLRTIAAAVVVPQAALIIRGNERSVFLVGGDGNAELRTVQMRYAFGESAVVDGIAVGEKVIIEGKQNLRPGTPVRESAVKAAGGRRGASAAAVDAAASNASTGVIGASGATP